MKNALNKRGHIPVEPGTALWKCTGGLLAVHNALARMFHPFLNLAGDMAKLGWFALTGNQTS
ncbi:MAG: hypothetical protein ABW161_16885, partial [Candidatus Thiodiazotropha sp.]